MKSLVFWLVMGAVVIVLSIALNSNPAILISLVLFVATPLCFVVYKKFQQVREHGDREQKLQLIVTENERRESENNRREWMRTEAAQLQAEYFEVQKIEDQYSRVNQMALWKMKSRIFNSKFEDVLEKERRFDDGLSMTKDDYVPVSERKPSYIK